MKKLLPILLLITSFGYGQTLLKLKAIEYAPGAGYVPYTDATGKLTYSLLTTVSPTAGLLPSTTSITINGSTQTFTSTPSFTVGNLNGSLTSGYVPYAVSSSSVVNTNIYYDGTNVGIGTPGPAVKLHVDGDIFTVGGTRSGGVAFGAYTFWGSASNEVTTNFSGTGNHLKLQDLGGGDVELSNASSKLKIAGLTANSILYADGTKNVSSVVLGSGLSLSSGTLTATGSGSTTTVTAGDNITVSGSAPSYTVGVSISPTFTNSTLTGTTTLTGVINHSMTASAASSATVDLSTWTGNYGHITGTVTITSFGTVQAGAKREITFDGSLTLTSNTVSLILPGNSDIQTAANDVAVFVSEGSGNWRCVSYMRNDESYTNYTPTWTGFTTAPTVAAGEARWKMLTKNTCQVIIYPSAAGTSNATTTTVTLPFAAYNAGTFGLPAYCIPILNNGAHALGSARGVSGSNVLNLYNGAIGGAWTAVGTLKAAYITIVYQIN